MTHHDDDKSRVVAALIRAFDKGAGAARRTRELDLTRGIFRGFVLLSGRWIEGQIGVASGMLTFVARPPSQSMNEHFSRAIITERRKFRIFREGGLRVARLTQVDFILVDGSTTIALVPTNALLMFRGGVDQE